MRPFPTIRPLFRGGGVGPEAGRGEAVVTAAGAGRGGERGGEGGAGGGRAWASGLPPRGRGLSRCRGPPRLGGEERGYTRPAPNPLSLFLHAPLRPRPRAAQPLPVGPGVPVALSSLGRKRFQKAQAWARSPRRTSSGRRFRLTYCCAPAVYGGHCGALGSRGSLGSLRKERGGSAPGV